MKSTQIFLDHILGLEVAVRLVNGRLDDLFLETDVLAPGTIFRAKVEKPVKGQGGFFVSFPGGVGFLKSTQGVSSGKRMLVQVSGYAEMGKAIPVTKRLLFKSRFVIVTPNAPGLNISRNIKDESLRDALLDYLKDELASVSFGLILRSSCATADFEDIRQDALAMYNAANAVLSDKTLELCMMLQADSPHRLAWREWTGEAAIFREKGCLHREGVMDLIEDLKLSEVKMVTGSYFIEKTQALTAVDVNTGSDTSSAAALKANIAMAKDLPRQLRLRGIGGQIIIDPAPITKKDRRLVDSVLKAAFRQDPVQTQILGWTALGLIELQRARTRAPLNL